MSRTALAGCWLEFIRLSGWRVGSVKIFFHYEGHEERPYQIGRRQALKFDKISLLEKSKTRHCRAFVVTVFAWSKTSLMGNIYKSPADGEPSRM